MKYTIVGVWEDNDYQRFADFYEADSPEEAEAACLEEHGDDLVIAGVFEGELNAVA